jgi:hypothetical protein
MREGTGVAVATAGAWLFQTGELRDGCRPPGHGAPGAPAATAVLGTAWGQKQVRTDGQSSL